MSLVFSPFSIASVSIRLFVCLFCLGLLFEFLVEALDVAVAFVLAVCDAVVTVSVGLFRRCLAPPQTGAGEPNYPVHAVADEEQAGPQDGGDVQQEVLVDGDVVDGRAQVLGAAVPQDVADPVNGTRHRMAGLIFVDLGQLQRFLSIPERNGTTGNRKRKGGRVSEMGTNKTLKSPKCSSFSERHFWP